MRWDPIEGRYCTVRLESVVYRDGQGVRREVDLGAVRSNAAWVAGTTHAFASTDPMLVLPITGPVGQLSIRGRWWLRPSAELAEPPVEARPSPRPLPWWRRLIRPRRKAS